MKIFNGLEHLKLSLEDIRRYQGKHVAVARDKKTILGSGKNMDEAIEIANRRGYKTGDIFAILPIRTDL